MKYSSIPLAQSVVAYCEAYNISHVVISPGSRNAPLTIGFTYNDRFSCYSIVDERCAAFFALGLAQQLGEPVALVCTSGSALLNYYPAISEAFFSHIPLVVLSADRPEHLVGIGDGQTIYQEHVFENHIFYSANLKTEETEAIRNQNNTLIDKALKTVYVKQGPVHINIPFNEPLYNTINECSVKVEKVRIPLVKKTDSENQIHTFKRLWKTSNRKMVLVGVLEPNSLDEEVINVLSDDDSLIVFTETTSNINDQNFFPSIDKIIAPLEADDFKELQPDFLLTFGGMVVSKKIKAFLRQYSPKEHWHIGPYEANDTFFSLTEHVKVGANEFLKAVLPEVKNDSLSHYRSNWINVRNHRAHMHKRYMQSIAFSDFLVFHQLLQHIPVNSLVQMGNSSVIRYAQLFDWNSSIQMFCNRGTSGIDGSTSTAIGAAVASNKPTVFVTGDLSFFYDSNALWNNYIPNNFKIILINNGGGGIFRILPGHKNTRNFDTYFETKHDLTAKQLCEMYNFKYEVALDQKELELQLTNLFKTNEHSMLLEVFTPGALNDEVLLNYFDFIK